jgi:holo-[acyl-carrier protein] synthase
MILGIGIDIIEVSRIENSYARFGDRFIERILRPDEIRYCLSHKVPGPFLAARFAAKEAISKAFGTGIGAQLSWQDMEVARKQSGEPFVILHDKGRELLNTRGATSLRISLSHTQSHAAAVAILESHHAAVS